MEVTFLIGRVIVGLYYISSGIRHFTHLNLMAGYAGSKGVPLPKLAIPASGVLLLIGGLSNLKSLPALSVRIGFRLPAA